jgi:transglutaminase-like putative cysteine protease
VSNEIQTLQEYNLEINPKPSNIQEHIDYFSNTTTNIFVKTSHQKLIVIANSLVDIDVKKLDEKKEKYKIIDVTFNKLQQHLKTINNEIIYVKQFLFPSNLIPIPSKEIIDYTMISFLKYYNLFEACEDFTKRIFNDFEFVSGFSDILTPIDTIFKEKKGVCQDFATLAISALRAIGIPTRYASGYIQTHPPKGKEKLFGVDASHAWFSVYLGEFGWVDFDPTNNKIPNEEYILLGYGRDYDDITPLKGVVQGSGFSYLNVRVDVRESFIKS